MTNKTTQVYPNVINVKGQSLFVNKIQLPITVGNSGQFYARLEVSCKESLYGLRE